MRLQAEFSVQDKQLPAAFGSFQDISDGGFQRGMQAEHDRFWSIYQQNGERTNYVNAFIGMGWTEESFKPMYDLKPVNAGTMFQQSYIRDLEACLDKAGVVLDMSNCTNAYRMFTYTYTQVIPELDLSSCTDLREMFLYGNPVIIRKLILSDSGTQNQTSMLYGVKTLEEVRFEGVINKGIDIFHAPNFSNESVQSIVDHLKDLTGAAPLTLTFHAKVGAAMTDEQKAAITAKNWTLVY